MDPFLIASVALFLGGMVVYMIMDHWRTKEKYTLETVARDIHWWLNRFDKWADAKYGEGGLPEHLSDIRDDMADTYNELFAEDDQ